MNRKPRKQTFSGICPLCYWSPSPGNVIQKLAKHLRAYHKAIDKEPKGMKR